MKKKLLLRGCFAALMASSVAVVSPANAGVFDDFSDQFSDFSDYFSGLFDRSGGSSHEQGSVHDRGSAHESKVNGTAFSKALYDGYSKLSDSVDPFYSERFSHKAHFAASPVAVPVDFSMDRHLSAHESAVFDQALMNMNKMFDRGARVVAPDLAAQAQVSYDCWIEAVEHGGKDSARAKACGKDFHKAIQALDHVANFALTDVNPYAEVADGTGLRPDVFEPEGISYLVHFKFDSSAPTAGGEKALKEAVETAKKHPATKLRIVAHTDSSGSLYYNKQLSQRRLTFVIKSMTSSGVDVDRIAPYALGENQPLVPTKDGVKEAGNRVVEISVLSKDKRKSRK